MSRFNLSTIFFLVTFVAFMMTSYRFLPEIARHPTSYSTFALTGCWVFATFGATIPVFVKQRFLSNRYWFVLVLISMIGTWTAFGLLYFWCENEAKRSAHFPGLGSFIFLAVAAIAAGFISFVLGWFVPWQSDR